MGRDSTSRVSGFSAKDRSRYLTPSAAAAGVQVREVATAFGGSSFLVFNEKQNIYERTTNRKEVRNLVNQVEQRSK